jgi:hypothetical protein
MIIHKKIDINHSYRKRFYYVTHLYNLMSKCAVLSVIFQRTMFEIHFLFFPECSPVRSVNKHVITNGITHHNNEQFESHISVGFTLALLKDIRTGLELSISRIYLLLQFTLHAPALKTNRRLVVTNCACN